uniref:Uncharacterized protein n=1 Tax=Trichogramma kaykai TaxID=54128 RepID=A0ABD2WPP2_9HYME
MNEFFNHAVEFDFFRRNFDRTRWKFLDFVNKTGYKDEPEVNRDGKPLLRRTTPLHHVSRFNNWTKRRAIDRDWMINPIIRKLFNIYNRFDLNYIDDLGCTHFHVACEYGLENVVQIFLELGQDPNLLVQKTGNSPLYLALSHDKREVSRLLLKHRADPNVANKDGRTPLHVVGKNYWNSPNMEMLFELKKKLKPGQVDARDKLGNTPLHLAVSSVLDNANHVVQALLEIGANPNLANDKGLTPMHFICKRRYSSDLRVILWIMGYERNQPVQLDARDKLGNTPLHLAALRSFDHHFRWLLRRGADPNSVNEEGLTPLHIIAKIDFFLAEEFIDISEELNHLVQIDARDKLGNTPLHYALKYARHERVELLLRNGADPNSVNEEGLTPLHAVAKTDNDRYCVDVFFNINKELNQLVQVDARDKLGRTPLQLAVANLYPDMVDVFLDNGADLSSFVFPTEDYFAEKLVPKKCEKTPNFKLRIASRAMAVVECLENRGFELDRSNALTVMKIFADYELFERSADFEKCGYGRDGGKLVSKARKTKQIKILWPTTLSNLSLYDLIRLQPEELAKLTLKDLYYFARFGKFCKLPIKLGEACVLHLCEMMSRTFFRSWATISFLDLTRCTCPVLCCEKIIENLKNEDYHRICLADALQSS